MSRLASTIEAILYLKAQPLTIAELAEYAGCDRDGVEEGLMDLMADYAHRDSALEVVETPNGFTLQLRESFHHLVQTLIPADLGLGALRTLAAIALKGPIAQTELVELRGSNAYQHVQELVELGFVRKRRQSDGRSYWLQVTNKFHQYFQLNQLPQEFTQNLKSPS
jgi:segregation and condensation protein B